MYRLPIIPSMPTNDPKCQKVDTSALYNFGKMVSEGALPPPVQCRSDSVTVNNEATDTANDTKSYIACDICAKADVCKYQGDYRLLFTTIKNSGGISGDKPFTLHLKCDKFSDIEDVY